METPEPRSATLDSCDEDTAIYTSDSLDEIDDSEDDSLSDIDDSEVAGYLNTEQEKCLKKIIWEELNGGYLKEQALKKAAAAKGTSKTASIGKSKEGRKRKQVSKANDGQPAAEDKRKRLSSRINYDVLDKLFEDEPRDDDDDAKRSRVESKHDDNSDEIHSNKSDEAYADEEQEDGDIEEGGYTQDYTGGWSYGGEEAEEVPDWTQDGDDDWF